jgi:hypothetical protein
MLPLHAQLIRKLKFTFVYDLYLQAWCRSVKGYDYLSFEHLEYSPTGADLMALQRITVACLVVLLQIKSFKVKSCYDLTIETRVQVCLQL